MIAMHSINSLREVDNLYIGHVKVESELDKVITCHFIEHRKHSVNLSTAAVINRLIDWLIDWLFTVLRPTWEYFTHMETSPLPVKGSKFLKAYARHSGPLSREGSFSCHTCFETGRLIRRTAPFSRLLRHTRGCGGSILTRIYMGSWVNEN